MSQIFYVGGESSTAPRKLLKWAHNFIAHTPLSRKNIQCATNFKTHLSIIKWRSVWTGWRLSDCICISPERIPCCIVGSPQVELLAVWVLRKSVDVTIRDTPEQRIAGRLWRLETGIHWRFPTIEVTVAIGSRRRRGRGLILLLAPENCSDRHVLIHATRKIEGDVITVVRVLASWWPQIVVVFDVLKFTDAL